MINGAWLHDSGTWGGDSRFEEKQFMYIGNESIGQGPERVAGTIVHEVIGHIVEGNAGATKLEEYYAWNISADLAQNTNDVLITDNPGGEGNNFRDWKSNLGVEYIFLNDRFMTQSEIDEQFAIQAGYIDNADQYYTEKYGTNMYSYPSRTNTISSNSYFDYWWMYMWY